MHFMVTNGTDNDAMLHCMSELFVIFCLPQLSQASYLWEMGKQCRTRSDARHVTSKKVPHSGCLQCVLLKFGENENYHSTPLKFERDLSY